MKLSELIREGSKTYPLVRGHFIRRQRVVVNGIWTHDNYETCALGAACMACSPTSEELDNLAWERHAEDNVRAILKHCSDVDLDKQFEHPETGYHAELMEIVINLVDNYDYDYQRLITWLEIEGL